MNNIIKTLYFIADDNCDGNT